MRKSNTEESESQSFKEEISSIDGIGVYNALSYRIKIYVFFIVLDLV